MNPIFILAASVFTPAAILVAAAILWLAWTLWQVNKPTTKDR